MTEALDAARSAYSKWYTIQSRVAVLANAFLILAQPVKLSTVSRRARIIPRAAPSRDWYNAGLGRDRPWRRGVDVLLHETPRANQPPDIGSVEGARSRGEFLIFCRRPPGAQM